MVERISPAFGFDACDFDATGVELVPKLISETYCDSLVEEVENAARTGAGSRKLLNAEWCRHLAQRIKTHPRVRRYLPMGAVAVQCTLFDKSERLNWLVALHQDVAIPVKEKVDSSSCSAWSEKEGVVFTQPPASLLEQLLAVRLSLDPCAPENGPLRVVPGSHRLGRLTPEQARLCREQAGEVRCEADRGGALLMRPLILHASSKSTSSAPRRVLHFLFGPEALPFGLQWHQAH